MSKRPRESNDIDETYVKLQKLEGASETEEGQRGLFENLPREMEATACTCDECSVASEIARDTQEPATTSTNRLLAAFTTCPHSGAAYCSGIAPLPRVLRHPDTGGRYPAPSRRLPPFEPHYQDLAAWRDADLPDLMRRLQQRFTLNSREVFKHPLYDRAEADFDHEKHDIYIDGVLCGEKQGWYGASSLNHMLFPEFDAAHRSRTSADAAMRRLLLTLLGVTTDMDTAQRRAILEPLGVTLPKGKLPKIFELWDAQRAEDAPRFLAAFKALKELEHLPEATRRIEEAIAAAETSPVLCEFFQDLLAEAFRKTWDHARRSGQAKHNLYDLFLQGKPLPLGELPPLGFLRAMAWLSEEYDVLGTEVTLFSKRWKFKSQADLFCIHRETGVIETFDFKNCKDDDLAVAGAPSEWGCHPFTAEMNNTKRNHYLLQLSMYRDAFATDYYPGGMVSTRATLLNFQPSKPEEFQVYPLECLDMVTRFFDVYMPWRKDDPKHVQFIRGPLADLCLDPFPNDDPRATNGPTTLHPRPRPSPSDGLALTALPDDYVWTCGAYDGYSYPLPAFKYKHPWSWFGAPRKGAAEYYEARLLQNPELLHYIPTLVGKRLLCWCRDQKHDRCHANVLAKYANLYANGAWTLDDLRHVLKIKDEKRGLEIITRVLPGDGFQF